MNRQFTNLEELLTLTLLALGVCLTLACTGCASVNTPLKEHEVKPFTIIVASPEYIQKAWESTGDMRDVGGFFVYATRTIYVEYNIHDHTQPNFEYLGHEVWHLEELGGRFHK